MSHTISIRNGMGTATISGSTVVMTGAKESDFYHFASDFLYGPGVQNIIAGDCAVAQNSPAGMSVIVAAGTVYVPQTSYTKNGSLTKLWRDEIDASEVLTIAANSSGSTRIDIVCEKVDTAATPNSEATNVGSYIVVQGTPGAGIPATPSNHFKLAEVTVANGASSIVTANITDKRIKAHMVDINLPEGYMLNGKITRTIATNAITVALKTLSGDDPSAINPVSVRIQDTFYLITSALSVTISAVTNAFNLNKTATIAQSIDLFTYLDYKASDGTIGIGLSLWGDSPTRTYGDFSGTNTNQAWYAGSHTPASTDRVVNIGRVSASMNASNQWSIGSVDSVIPTPILVSRELTHVGLAAGAAPMVVSGTIYSTRSYKIEGNWFITYFDISSITLSGTATSGLTLDMPFNAQNGGTFISNGYNAQSNLGYLQHTVSATMIIRKSDGTNMTLNSGNQFTGTMRVRGL